MVSVGTEAGAAALVAIAFSMSFRTILPSGPVPVILVISRACSSAFLRATGEIFIRSFPPATTAGSLAGTAAAWAAAAVEASATVAVVGTSLGTAFCSASSSSLVSAMMPITLPMGVVSPSFSTI